MSGGDAERRRQSMETFAGRDAIGPVSERGWQTGAYDVKPPHATLGDWALSLADECDEAGDPETAEVLRRLVHDLATADARGPVVMAGVVRRDGLREAVTALRDKWVADEGRTWISNCGDELSAVLDAVPDVPPATPLADHIKAGMLRGRVRLSDVPPDPPAADRDELARVLGQHRLIVNYGQSICRCGQRLVKSPNDSASHVWQAHHAHVAAVISGVLVDAADVRARYAEELADAIQALHPGEVKASVTFLRDRAVSERDRRTT